MKKKFLGIAFVCNTLFLQAQFYKQEQFKSEISEIKQSKIRYYTEENLTIDDGSSTVEPIKAKEKEEYTKKFYKFTNKKPIYEVNSYNDSIVYSYEKDKLISFKIYRNKNKVESYKLKYNNSNVNIYSGDNLITEKVYDKNNNIIKATFYDSKDKTTTAGYYYNKKKQLITVEYANHIVNVDNPFHQVQNTIKLEYDSNGFLIKEIDFDSETIYKYDEFGNWVEKVKINNSEYATSKKIVTKRKIKYLN